MGQRNDEPISVKSQNKAMRIRKKNDLTDRYSMDAYFRVVNLIDLIDHSNRIQTVVWEERTNFLDKKPKKK